MSYCRIESSTVVTVPDHRNLLAVWAQYGHTRLIGAFRCTKPLTALQIGRLPPELRRRVAERDFNGDSQSNGPITEYRHECPECGEVYTGGDRWNFCPVCGAALNVQVRVASELRKKFA